MKHLLLTTIAAVVLVGCGSGVDIWTAAQTGNIEAVKQNLADGVDVNSKSDIGRTPLDVAIAFKQSLITDLLRKHGGKTRDELKAAESIEAAAELGNIEAVKQHLNDGTEVNAKGETGRTPLHWAAIEGYKEIAELLIAEGADVNAKNKADATPLDKAIEKNQDETVSLLREHGGKATKESKPAEPVSETVKPEPPIAKAPDISIHAAAKAGNVEAVKQLLAAGADVELKCVNCGGTVLGHAAINGHKELAELLIAKGADVNTKNKDSTTPLHQASLGGRKEVVELLIANGADVNAKVVSGTKQGLTPLDAANETNHPETAALLRKHGGKTGEELKATAK